MKRNQERGTNYGISRCGTQSSRLVLVPALHLELAFEPPEFDFSFTLPSFDLELERNLALDHSLAFGFSFTLPSLDFYLDLNLPAIQFGAYLAAGSEDLNAALGFVLELPTLEMNLFIPALDLNLALDLELEFALPAFDFSFDFALDFGIVGGAFLDKPIATINAHLAYLNILPFGLCKSSGNPKVAAGGKPVSCTPKTDNPWVVAGAAAGAVAGAAAGGGAGASLGGEVILNDSGTLSCAYGCMITVLHAGQLTLTVD